MPTTSELIAKYREMPITDLHQVFLQIDEYSEEAQAAFHLVVEEYGGKDALLAKIEKKEQLQQETNRVYRKIHTLVAQGLDADEIRNQISTSFIPPDHIERLIQRCFQKNESEKNDQRVTSKTLIGGLVGASIGCVLSTILWAGMLIYTGMLFYIVIPALAVICYGCIWLFTKQSKKNGVVLLLIILATGCAMALGWGIYMIVGYQGSGY